MGSKDSLTRSNMSNNTTINKPQYDVVIIGGGFFGCQLALYLQEHFDSICILEKESDLMERASYNNQARVHNGYHYPRSLLTAFRSRLSFKQFCNEFSECIVDNFDKLSDKRVASAVGMWTNLASLRYWPHTHSPTNFKIKKKKTEKTRRLL